MDLSEVLKEAGVNYPNLIGRFSGNEAMLKKFLLKLPADKTFGDLTAKVAEEDYDGILTAAHTLKGISANLGFDRLSTACAKVVSAVREGRNDDALSCCQEVNTEYDIAIKCIDKIEK